MTQLTESHGDLNLNLMGGFNIVAACSDNWRQSLCVIGNKLRLSLKKVNAKGKRNTTKISVIDSSKSGIFLLTELPPLVRSVQYDLV